MSIDHAITLISSFAFISFGLGLWIGNREGKEQGFAQGRAEGWVAGIDKGRAEGWAQANEVHASNTPEALAAREALWEAEEAQEAREAAEEEAAAAAERGVWGEEYKAWANEHLAPWPVDDGEEEDEDEEDDQ